MCHWSCAFEWRPSKEQCSSVRFYISKYEIWDYQVLKTKGAFNRQPLKRVIYSTPWCTWGTLVNNHALPEARIVCQTLNTSPRVVTARVELHRHLQGQTHRLLVFFITHPCSNMRRHQTSKTDTNSSSLQGHKDKKSDFTSFKIEIQLYCL